MNTKYSPQIITVVILGVLLIMSTGINDAGNRTVVQYPTGNLLVKFTPGIYMKWFGTTTIYRDVLTYDYDKMNEGVEASMSKQGISVRYQDGGTGTVYGKARFSLPNDELTMLSLHKAFRSNAGVASKLIKTVTEEGMNLTAGLMSSEAAYTEKRSIFTQWASEQISSGKYQTELKQISTVDERTGKRV